MKAETKVKYKRVKRAWVFIPGKFAEALRVYTNGGNFRKEMNIYTDGNGHYIKCGSEWVAVHFNWHFGEWEVW